MVLHCGPGANGEHLAVEPVIGGQLNPDPAACTEHMLGLLEGLPEEPRRLWQSCTSRVFDYGFDGGLEENPMSASLSPAQLRRVADLGLELRMTVYPYRSHDPSQGE